MFSKKELLAEHESEYQFVELWDLPKGTPEPLLQRICFGRRCELMAYREPMCFLIVTTKLGFWTDEILRKHGITLRYR